jgi:biotin carboxyl carrier protein
MEYKIQDIEDTFNAEVIQILGNSEYLAKINDKEKHIKILNMSTRGIELLLDQKYHNVKYLENTTASIRMVVDSVPITLNKNHKLKEIVYKNTGETGRDDTQVNLRSQIPGKVVSIGVEEGSKVKKGDVICVLESMKMQVSVKSHKDGVVKKIKIKKGGSVAKNDVITEIE